MYLVKTVLIGPKSYDNYDSFIKDYLKCAQMSYDESVRTFKENLNKRNIIHRDMNFDKFFVVIKTIWKDEETYKQFYEKETTREETKALCENAGWKRTDVGEEI